MKTNQTGNTISRDECSKVGKSGWGDWGLEKGEENKEERRKLKQRIRKEK